MSDEQSASDVFRARSVIGDPIAGLSVGQIVERWELTEGAKPTTDCQIQTSGRYLLGEVEFRVVRVYFDSSVFSDYVYHIYLNGATSEELSGRVEVG